MKKLTVIAFPATLLLGGRSGALWGNLVVLAITVGIFVGTLSLGRSSSATRSDGSPTRTG
jgi:hypothetical protein